MSKLRLDRAASVYLFYPLSRKLPGPTGPRIPILMYHGIGEGASNGHAYYETNTSPRIFAQHMRYLRENGYRSVSLDEGVRVLELGEALNKLVVVTFDDGFRDFYTSAFPVLRENAFTATVFLVAGLTGEDHASFNERELLTWREARELSAQGIQFGSHSLSHPPLKELSEAQLDEEVGRSKNAIEDHLGNQVTSFSYPYAFPESDKYFVGIFRETLKRFGYKNGVSTVIGTARSQHDRFFLPRLPVNSWDDLPLFRAKLEGGYDWLHGPQKFYKTLFK